MYSLKFETFVPLELERCWSFFSAPANLKLLTPPALGFEIVEGAEPQAMYPGQIIVYRVRPLFHIPCTWVTEITQVQPPHYFIDEQRVGPYQLWHHEHRFRAVDGGVAMTDLIYYRLPYGWLGAALLGGTVRRQLEAIFSYRQERLRELFPAGATAPAPSAR